MTRVSRSSNLRQRHQKKLKLAKGFRGAGSILYRTANQHLLKSFHNGLKSRRLRKSDFRSIWIRRINGKVRQYGINYNGFISSRNLNFIMNRKILAQLAIYDPVVFEHPGFIH
uniref:50S ribosomal protein L20 n=1 Tax=Caulerpa cliftonii TaxID=1004391 RepID=A0A1C9JBU1_9CHLO|nr:ribosomal protein L20 [Caulerpa cliftonii]AOP19325.1 ribosomal protein L20 [Caulerpa cliftonii]